MNNPRHVERRYFRVSLDAPSTDLEQMVDLLIRELDDRDAPHADLEPDECLEDETDCCPAGEDEGTLPAKSQVANPSLRRRARVAYCYRWIRP